MFAQDLTPFHLKLFEVSEQSGRLDTMSEVPNGGYVIADERMYMVQFHPNPDYHGAKTLYFAVFDIQPDGVINLIFPDLSRGQEPLDFALRPGESSFLTSFKILFAPPFGRESFVTVFTEVPMDYSSVIHSRGNSISPGQNHISRTELEWILTGKAPEIIKDAVLIDRFNFDILPADKPLSVDTAKTVLRGTLQNQKVGNEYPDITMIYPPEPALSISGTRGATAKALEHKSASIVVKGQVYSRNRIDRVEITVRSNRNSDLPAPVYSIPIQDSSGNLHYFEKQVYLQPGMNEIEVKAINDRGLATQTSLVVEVQPDTVIVDTSQGRDFLVVIAANDYVSWTDLKNPINDAERFAEVLTSHYGFPEEHIARLYNKRCNTQTIDSLFRTLITRVLKPSDRIVVYYAGHGHYDGLFDNGYWIPFDGKSSITQNGTWLGNPTIAKYIEYLPTQHTLFIADACFSGSLFLTEREGITREELNRIQNPRSRYLISSGNLEHVADTYHGSDHSPFAHFLLEFLEHPTKTTFNAAELANHVSIVVSKYSGQTPIGKPVINAGDEGGSFLFKYRP
ncbi:MAG: caspase family protein [Flavobacteriales bacterium]|nr:caspase family protein [Flavobacteriales bacterium]